MPEDQPSPGEGRPRTGRRIKRKHSPCIRSRRPVPASGEVARPESGPSLWRSVAIIEVAGDQQGIDLFVQTQINNPQEDAPRHIADQLRQLGIAQCGPDECPAYERIYRPPSLAPLCAIRCTCGAHGRVTELRDDHCLAPPRQCLAEKALGMAGAIGRRGVEYPYAMIPGGVDGAQGLGVVGPRIAGGDIAEPERAAYGPADGPGAPAVSVLVNSVLAVARPAQTLGTYPRSDLS